MRQRTEEIRRQMEQQQSRLRVDGSVSSSQELAARRMDATPDQPSSSSPPGVVSSSAVLGTDAFLGNTGAVGIGIVAATGTTNVHSREESADSGLGLSTNNSYSLPHTPEDFLGANTGYDEMDST
ncbi:unnamed protein product, partial [Notodromas monacha]